MAVEEQAGTEQERFPLLWLGVMVVGLTASLTVQQVAAQTAMSAGVYWTLVAAGGGVLGAGTVPFFARFNAWTRARKAAGKSAWWERLP